MRVIYNPDILELMRETFRLSAILTVVPVPFLMIAVLFAEIYLAKYRSRQISSWVLDVIEEKI